jgi:phage FluMu protein Com
MPIEFRCLQCGKLLRTGDDTAGKQAKCPECGAVMPIPGETPKPEMIREWQDIPSSPFGPSSAAENPYQSPAAFPAAAWAVPAGEIRPTRIGFGETLSRAWAVFSDSWLVVLGALLLMLLVYFAGYFVMASIAAGIGIAIQDRDAARILVQAAQFGAALLSLWLNIGLQLFALGVARGEQPRYGLLFAGGPRLLPVIGCFLLTGLVVFGGVLLLVVPGLIFLMMLSQAQLLVIDRQLGVLEAMSLSAKIMAGNKLLVMGIWIITGVLAYLAVLVTCGLGLFAAAPYLLILKIVIYLSASGQPTIADRYAAAASPFVPQGSSPFQQQGESPFLA